MLDQRWSTEFELKPRSRAKLRTIMKGFPIPQKTYYIIQDFDRLLLPLSTDQCQLVQLIVNSVNCWKSVSLAKKLASISVTAYI